MDVQHLDGETEAPVEVFTVAQLEETPAVPRGAVRNPCRWFGLTMLLFEPVLFIGWCIAKLLLPLTGL